MTNVKIREAIPTDAKGIATIHVLSWQKTYKGLMPDDYLQSLNIDQRTDGWREQINNPTEVGKIFVAEHNGQVVGWTTAGPSRDEDAFSNTGELYAIYVHPDFEHHGAGSKLMDEALAYLKSQMFTRATLWVLITNQKARDWYQKKGWTEEGKTKIDHRKNFELHEVRYQISLI